MNASPVIVWFRHDLRLADHPALSKAAATGASLVPVFVLDDETPGNWRPGSASRWWLHESLKALKASIKVRGGRLLLLRGETTAALTALVDETGARELYFSRAYEPFSVKLESRLCDAMKRRDVSCHRFGGSLLFEPEQLRNRSGDPYRVFTPFYKSCLNIEPPSIPLPEPRKVNWAVQNLECDRLEDWCLQPRKPDWAGGLRESWQPGEVGGRLRLAGFLEGSIARYHSERDFPGVDGTSRLSPYLRFGEISPRQIWHAVLLRQEAEIESGATAFLRELIWREFSFHLLFHWPSLPEVAFKPEFDRWRWNDDETVFDVWQRGETGYPVVDAGLRELWHTGYMHNRVRMIVASFLIKDLLIDWRRGQEWFWDTLVDADLANNASSWQWVAGSGADAAPYFRIFNPEQQSRKFDSDGIYLRRWLPELRRLPARYIHNPSSAPSSVLKEAGVSIGGNYPAPIVDHSVVRKRALAAYAAIKEGNRG